MAGAQMGSMIPGMGTGMGMVKLGVIMELGIGMSSMDNGVTSFVAQSDRAKTTLPALDISGANGLPRSV